MLENYAPRATLPVSDMERAKAWYRDKLGLSPKEEGEGGAFYETGGSGFSLFTTQYAGTAKNTQMEWSVDDIRVEMAELRKRGVTFDTFEMDGVEWDDGLATMGDWLGAWFKDSEGNTLALTQSPKR